MPTITVANSSSVQVIEYDGTDCVVTFANGRVYRYADVPESVFLNISQVAANPVGSVGAAVSRFLKGCYEFEEVTA
jgi:hypothetical protein